MKKKFVREVCKEEFSQEANLKNYRKLCMEGGVVVGGKRRCDLCSKEVGKKNYAAHRRCGRGRGGDPPADTPPQARVYKASRKPCPECGKVMASASISRHLREACQGGGAGP